MERKSFGDKVVSLFHRIIDMYEKYKQAKFGEGPALRQLDEYHLTPAEVNRFMVELNRGRRVIAEQGSELLAKKVETLAAQELAHYNGVAAELLSGEIEEQKVEVQGLEKSLRDVKGGKAILEGKLLSLDKQFGWVENEFLTSSRKQILDGAYQGIKFSPLSQILVEFVKKDSMYHLEIRGINNAMLGELGYRGDAFELRGVASRLEEDGSSILEILPHPTQLLDVISKRRLAFCLTNVGLNKEKIRFLRRGSKRVREYSFCHVTPVILEYKTRWETIGAILSPLSESQRKKLHKEGAIEFYTLGERLEEIEKEPSQEQTNPSPNPQLQES